jgi:hypothetical protein
MDHITIIIASWEYWVLAVGISAVIHVIGIMGSTKDAVTGVRTGGLRSFTWWQRINPIFPFVLGIGASFIPGMLPVTLPAGIASKIMFGILAALASDKAYQLVNTQLKLKK